MLTTIALSITIEASSPAKLAGAKVPIDAVVISVDPKHRRATIRYAALETAPAGVRLVRVGDPGALRTMHRGEEITAVADTSHTPWILSHVIRKVGLLIRNRGGVRNVQDGRVASAYFHA